MTVINKALATDQALILHTLPYSDNDLIVTLLGQRTGRINAFAKNGRASKKRFGSGLMAGAQVEVILNPPGGDSDLWRLKELSSLSQWPWMAPDEIRLPIKLGGSYILDILKNFSQVGAPDPELYRLSQLAMAHLHSTPDVVEFLCRFQVRLLLINGICPDFSICGRCGAPLEASSGWVYGDVVVGPCCRRLLPIEPGTECPGTARLALLTLVAGGRPSAGTIDKNALRLTRQLLGFHFQRTLKSADLLDKVLR